MIRYADQPTMGRGGVLAMAGSAGVALVGWMRLLAVPGPPSLIFFLALAAAGGAMLIVVAKLPMPRRLRLALTIALVGTMMATAAQVDLFGARALDHAMGDASHGIDEVRQTGSAVAAYATGRPMDDTPGNQGQHGAEVQLIPAAEGDAGWAARLDRAWGGRLGGAAAAHLRITGEVRAEGATVAMHWQIADGGPPQRCGTSSSTGGDASAISDALGEPMRQAVARSIALGRAACP